MDTRHQQERKRIGAKSHSMIKETHKSCDDTASHVDASHAAIAKSLRLLGTPFHRLDE